MLNNCLVCRRALIQVDCIILPMPNFVIGGREIDLIYIDKFLVVQCAWLVGILQFLFLLYYSPPWASLGCWYNKMAFKICNLATFHINCGGQTLIKTSYKCRTCSPVKYYNNCYEKTCQNILTGILIVNIILNKSVLIFIGNMSCCSFVFSSNFRAYLLWMLSLLFFFHFHFTLGPSDVKTLF